MEQFSEIMSRVGVEWPNFIAQLIVFAILYLILKQFAFKPVLAMLEERRKRIEEAEANSEKVKEQLAEAEKRYHEILEKANEEAQKLIGEARTSGESLAEKKRQEAVGEAERIIAKAREATEREHEQVLNELKKEVGRMVIDTTTKVTGKVLTPEDHKRINEEASRQLAA